MYTFTYIFLFVYFCARVRVPFACTHNSLVLLIFISSWCVQRSKLFVNCVVKMLRRVLWRVCENKAICELDHYRVDTSRVRMSGRLSALFVCAPLSRSRWGLGGVLSVPESERSAVFEWFWHKSCNVRDQDFLDQTKCFVKKMFLTESWRVVYFVAVVCITFFTIHTAEDIICLRGG